LPTGAFAAPRHPKEWLEKASPQAETQAVKQAAREAQPDAQALDDFRFVSSKGPLAVRSTVKANGPQAGSLRFGQAVRVLRKDGDSMLTVDQRRQMRTHSRRGVLEVLEAL
jgi:hypothetical protein